MELWTSPAWEPGKADLQWSEKPSSQELKADVDAGVRPYVSIGYIPHEAEKIAEKDGVETWLITRWEPEDLHVCTLRNRITERKEDSMKKTDTLARPFYRSKEWWTGLIALIAGIGAIASGKIELTLANLQELGPVTLLVAGGIAAMFSASGRIRIERQLEDAERSLATLVQSETRPASSFTSLQGIEETIENLATLRKHVEKVTETSERAGTALDMIAPRLDGIKKNIEEVQKKRIEETGGQP